MGNIVSNVSVFRYIEKIDKSKYETSDIISEYRISDCQNIETFDIYIVLIKKSFVSILSNLIIARYSSILSGGGHKEGGDGDTTPPVLGGDASAVGPGLPPEADDYFKVRMCLFFALCVVCVLCVFFISVRCFFSVFCVFCVRECEYVFRVFNLK